MPFSLHAYFLLIIYFQFVAMMAKFLYRSFRKQFSMQTYTPSIMHILQKNELIKDWINLSNELLKKGKFMITNFS